MSKVNQVWKGFFSYLFKDSEGVLYDNPIPFQMELYYEKGSFTGTTVDEESKGLFTEPITVNGFIEGKFINFIVKYPHIYYFDEELNQLVVDYTKEYPGCEYTGEYDEVESKYFGEWRLEVKEKRKGLFQSDYLVDSAYGYWEMKREK